MEMPRLLSKFSEIAVKKRHRWISPAGMALPSLLAAALVGGCGGSNPDGAQESSQLSAVTANAPDGEFKKLRFLAGLAGQPYFAHIYLALEKGYFRDEGLDVSIEPLPSGATAARVTEELREGINYQVGTGNSAETMVVRQSGTVSPFAPNDLISLGATIRGETLGIMTRADFPLPALEQVNALSPDPAQPSVLHQALSGKRIGITGLAANRAVLLDIFKRYRVKYQEVPSLACIADPSLTSCVPLLPDHAYVVPVGGSTPTLLADGRIDAIGDAPIWRIPAIYNATLGMPDPSVTTTYRRLEFRDLGAPASYIVTMNASEKWVLANPRLARGFMKAFARGLKDAIRDPEMAIDAYMKHVPTPPNAAWSMDYYRKVNLVQWDATRVLAADGDTDRYGLGWQDPLVFDRQWQFLTNAGILREQDCAAASVCVRSAMTNDYLPD